MKRLWYFEVKTADYYVFSKLFPTKKSCIEAAKATNWEYTIGFVLDD